MYDIGFRKKAFKKIVSQYEKQYQSERGVKSRIAQSLGLTRAAVTLWEKQGVPKSRIPYFKLKFPDLDIWK